MANIKALSVATMNAIILYVATMKNLVSSVTIALMISVRDVIKIYFFNNVRIFVQLKNAEIKIITVMQLYLQSFICLKCMANLYPFIVYVYNNTKYSVNKHSILVFVYAVIMKKSFGNNLKIFREMNDLSQCQLAHLLGTSQQRISKWENDKIEPNLYNIIKLIKALNTSFEELTDDIEI